MIFKADFSVRDLDALLEGFEFPDSFDLGVSTAGYQVEGGFNGPGDPKNNWHPAEASGKVQRTGACARFMDLYEEDAARAAGIGLSAFRMGIEWARLQPEVDPASKKVPPFSLDAARTYARIMSAIFDRGMFPAVTLHHFTNPLWAGLDFWLDRTRVVELFSAYVDFAVREINRSLTEDFGKPPIPYYITINEPFMVPMATYLLGVFAGGGTRGMKAAVDCYTNLLIGHVLCYRTIHRIYKEKGWPRPTVTVNTWCSAIYSMDRLAQDFMTAKANGIARQDLRAYMTDQRDRFNAMVRGRAYYTGPQSWKRRLHNYLDAKLWNAVNPDALSPLADAVYEGGEERLVDAVGFDYYDPYPGNYVDFGFPMIVSLRKQPWDWTVNPGALGTFLKSYSQTAGGLPIHILENGLGQRGIGTRGVERRDGARRDELLKAAFFEMIKAIRAGIDLRAYCFWSLIDNYEWGQFEPRFGLFAVDYQNGARRLDRDIMGDNSAGAYSLLVKAFSAKDKTALREALLAKSYPSKAKG